MKMHSARSVHIKGLVQGVGFRPFIYRLAISCNIKGWVENGNDGVRIHAEGTEEDLEKFIGLLPGTAPAASQITEVNFNITVFQHFTEFLIRKSTDYSEEITDISPDIAVCDECLSDMKNQVHRAGYPFINCTNCGPRFSIIKGLPYDRSKTTMEPFRMCPVCEKEYQDVLDRRFHAQPVACNQCGPHYKLIHKGLEYSGTEIILAMTVDLLDKGCIVAIKGTGGFHLACDATNIEAVAMLRKRKFREGKPFAVMFRDLSACSNYMDISAEEADAMQSWRKPIVILKNKKDGGQLAPGVSNGFDTTGVMLPYMPIHYILFERLATPAIVLTSGNLSDEPVIIDDSEAIDRLSVVADAFLVYNRDIYNRTDDSVMMVTGGKSRLIRRSRGYAPSPANLSLDVDGIIATGAELVNCFCLGKGQKALMSQHIGDLKNLETLGFFEESMGRFVDMFRVKPRLLVCDLHPDYLSTRFAEEFSKLNGNIPIERVQHHHAHIASCMAEYGLDEEVIGISMDGTGYGSDGNIWGFEVMQADLLNFKRRSHLEYIPQPGSDMANHEPWRMALAYLWQYIDRDFDLLALPFMDQIDAGKRAVVRKALEHKINTPLTSSAGRLFDAVAAMTGVCTISDFHAEAPMRLENILDPGEPGQYHFAIGTTIDPGPVIKGIVADITEGVNTGRISAKFHRAVVDVIVKIVVNLINETGINKIVLSGGSFQNRFLVSESEKRLREYKLEVYSQQKFPSNDGGIALGQLVIAAKRRERNFKVI
jgi:hydrogenase maturation protein HypF